MQKTALLCAKLQNSSELSLINQKLYVFLRLKNQNSDGKA